MPTIEERALALVNEVAGFDYLIAGDVMDDDRDYMLKALCRAIEAHDATLAEFEAFKHEVSDRVEAFNKRWTGAGESHSDFMSLFSRFILPKPVDPLVEAIREASVSDADDGDASRLRAALAKRGLKLVEVGDAD